MAFPAVLYGLYVLGGAIVRASSPAIAAAVRSQGGKLIKRLTKSLTKKYGQPKTLNKPPKINAKLGQDKSTGTSVTKPSGGSNKVTKPTSTSVSKTNQTPTKKVFEGEVLPPLPRGSRVGPTRSNRSQTVDGKVNKPTNIKINASKLKTAASVAQVIAADKLGTKSGTKNTKVEASDLPKKKKTEKTEKKKTSVNKTPNYAGSRGIPKKSAVDTSKIKKPKKTEKVKREVLKKTKEKNYTGKFVNEKGEVAYDSIGDFFSNMAGTAKKREAPKDRKKIKSAKKGATKGVGFSGKSISKPFSKKKK